jgi:hypothetical protein
MTRSNNKKGMLLLHSEHYVDALQITLAPVEQYKIHTITVDFNRLKVEIKNPKGILRSIASLCLMALIPPKDPRRSH